jgi:AMP phosphorylase
MELKIKNVKIEAGRPIAFISEKNARKLDLHIGERVQIFQGSQRTVATADISSQINNKEIALSQEVLEYVKLNSNKPVKVLLAIEPQSIRFITKKLQGKSLSKDEIFSIIKDIVNNSLSEAEIAYFVSAVYEHKMSFKETINLTEAIYKTGMQLSWHDKNIADKHSIGGIAGNRTTPIVVSICAAAGVVMPKTSSRAITSAAGTADTMEVITKVDFPASDLKKIVKKTNACLAWGGSLGLAPADDKLIRVERLLNVDPEAQLLASIMSKKLAAGSKYVLIDIPYGPQAKVSKDGAKELGKKFMKIAKYFKMKMRIMPTLGDQPIGNGVGPVLEMIDVLKVLKQENQPMDLQNKSVHLAAEILEMVGKAKKGKGEFLARSILETGAAFEKFNEIIDAQGRKKEDFSLGKYKYEFKSPKSGRIAVINNKATNFIARSLGCPEDKRAGIYIHKHKGEAVTKDQVLLTLYAESKDKLKEAIPLLNAIHVISVI